MNKLSLILIVLLTFSISTCNLEEKNYSQEINNMKDTLFKVFPTVNRISVEVKQDFGTEVNITLGDITLYQETAKSQQATADKIGAIVESVFGHEKLPNKGTLVITSNETTINTNATTDKTYDMHLHKQ